MAHILLIDTHSSVLESLTAAGSPSLEWGSFGNPIAGGPEHVFRDPREYKVVVHDALNASGNWEHETMTDLQSASRFYLGYPAHAELLSRLSFAYQRQYLFDDFLKSGGVLVVFAGPQEGAPLPPWGSSQLVQDPRAQVFVWGANPFTKQLSGFGERHWRREIHSYFCLLPEDEHTEENPFLGPTAIRYSPRKGPYEDAFSDFAEQYGDSMRWNAAWPDNDYRDRRHPLFRNTAGDCVGFVEEKYRLNDLKSFPGRTPGLFIVLPNIPEIARRTEAIVTVLRDVMPTLRPGLLPKWVPPPEPPESWFARYDPPLLASKEASITQRRGQLDADEHQLVIERTKSAHYKELLRQKDDSLHELVGEVFHDVFGFEVTNLDEHVPPGQPRGADLLAMKEGLSMLIEAKGAGHTTLQREIVNAFVNNITKYEREHGPVTARLLLMNGEASKPPESRHAFSPEIVQFATDNGLTVMSAITLFHLVERRQQGVLPDEEIHDLLRTPGLVDG